MVEPPEPNLWPTGSGGLLFVGSKGFGLSCLAAVAAELGEDLIGIGALDDSTDPRSELAGFRELAAQLDVPLRTLSGPGHLTQLVTDARPSAVLVIGWYWLIDRTTRPMAANGFYGVHASLLPKYRGNAPLVWAIINGETSTGVSLFRLEDGIDDGGIVAQAEFEIALDDTIESVLRQAELSTKQMLVEHVRHITMGDVALRPQVGEASYCGLRTPQDGLIDWRMSAESIHDFVRAQTHPYPGAYARRTDGGAVRVWRTRPFPHSFSGVPGSVESTAEGELLISCGRGALYVLEHSLDDETASTIRRGERLH